MFYLRVILSLFHIYGLYVVMSSKVDLELLGSLVNITAILGMMALFIRDINLMSIDRMLPTLIHFTLLINYRDQILSSYLLIILLSISVLNDYLFSRYRIIAHHILSRIYMYFLVHLVIS